MELHTFEVKLPDSYRQEWRLYFIGDIHYSHLGCDRRALNGDIKEVAATPNAYWFGMGDYDEYITFTDPRFDPEAFDKDTKVDFLKMMGEKQTRKIVDVLEPIKDKCIGIVEGNHELEYGKRNDYDPAVGVAKGLNTKFLSYEALTRIYVSGPDGRKRYSIVVFTHHGWGGGMTEGAALNRLAGLVKEWDADIYVTGHNHKMVSAISPRLGINTSGKYYSRSVVLITSGTYLKTKQVGIQGYEVKKGGKPTPIGCSKIRIKGNNAGNFGIEAGIEHKVWS